MDNDLDLSMYGIDTSGPVAQLTFEERFSYIIRKMLQTAYTFADKVPSEVYMYLQMHPDGKAILECLFKVEGKLYEIQELNEAEIEHQYEITEEKQLQWLGFMSQGVNEMRELFDSAGKWFPDEVWGWVDIEGNGETHSRMQWGPENYEFPPAKAILRGWKEEILTLPEKFDEWLKDASAIENARWDILAPISDEPEAPAEKPNEDKELTAQAKA